MRIVTVCGCGLGTCLLLKMTVESVLNEAGVDAEVIHSDLGSATSIDCDLFVITLDMENQFKESGKKYVSIKNVSDKNEMKEKLSPFIE